MLSRGWDVLLSLELLGLQSESLKFVHNLGKFLLQSICLGGNTTLDFLFMSFKLLLE
jgi:hypothetical protein